MKVFTATLGTETDSFSPIPIGEQAFVDTMRWRPGEHPDFPTEATGPLWVCRQRAREQGWQVVEGTCAFAMPGGLVSAAAYTKLRDEILEQLRAALPVDIVALGLHGAMMAHGTPDCEGDLLTRVRQMVGPAVAVGAELDCHAHLSAQMMAQADVLVCFKEYPHTDFIERAEELLTLLEQTRRGAIRPVMRAFDCEMIASMGTTAEPMSAFVAQMKTLEVAPILSVSLVHGFVLGDNADMGTKMLVVSEDDAAAEALASQLAHQLFALRAAFRSERRGFEEMLATALAMPREPGPIILVDVSDNPGSGAAGDATALLRAMHQRETGSVCCGPLWDPVAVRFCFEAGVGARIRLRIGGKVGPDSGAPMDVEAEVVALTLDHAQTMQNARVPLGDSAAIRFDDIALVLTSLRDQAYDPSLFDGLGIDCRRARFIVLKSRQQFRIGFEAISRRIVEVPRDARPALAYKHVKRPKWPLDPDHVLH